MDREYYEYVRIPKGILMSFIPYLSFVSTKQAISSTVHIWEAPHIVRSGS